MPLPYAKVRLTCVVEELADLSAERGDDNIIEEGVKACKDYTTDNNADNDLDAGIDIALTCGGLDCSLSGNDCLVKLGLDRVDKILHIIFTSFFLLVFGFSLITVVQFLISRRKRTCPESWK